MMDPDLKRRWIENLRSGAFKQTKGRLQDETGNCCLGVLCITAGANIRTSGNGSVSMFFIGTDTWPNKSIDSTLADKLGVPEIVRDDLAAKNDAGISFDAIADIIEKHPEL